MGLSHTLNLVAGVTALVLGGGVLLRAPGRPRNRALAALCAALAAWNLGVIAYDNSAASIGWRLFYLAGSCAIAPLSLRFVMLFSGAPRRERRVSVALATTAVTILWLTAWPAVHGYTRAWRVAAILIIGAVLVQALWVIGRQVRSLSRGPERNAVILVLISGVLAAVTGISDFLPRTDDRLIQIGPFGLLLFMLVLSAVTLRHRFLDVGTFFLRAVTLLGGAALVAMVFFLVFRLVDRAERYWVLFLTSVLVIALVVPLGRAVLEHTRGLLAPRGPMAHALFETSRRLSAARDAKQIWDAIDDAVRMIPGKVELEIHVQQNPGSPFVPFTRGGARRSGPSIPRDDALAAWLARDGAPVTRRYLERERDEADPCRAELATRALRRLDAGGVALVVPLGRGKRMQGWIALVGEIPERHLTGFVATALLAVANQAAAGVDRVHALDQARRSEALAAVGELAAGLAHEVRNPVAAIRGAAQALGPAATEEQRREMLAVIEEESERLGRFVGEFLDWARPQSASRKPVDTVALVRGSLERMRLAGLAMESELIGDSPAFVAGDRDQLGEVVDNLLRNAFESAGPGGKLTIVIEPGPAAVVLRVIDNGPGIPDATAARLFQPFFTTKSRGTGLGLALVQRVVQDHGGEVWVATPPAGGAEFVVSLPGADR